MKKILFTQRNDRGHWVGDGFPVMSIFSYNDQPEQFSPFLLMDYGGPANFPPTSQKKGVGEHPHRGFETVTIVYEGEVEHRDSAGGGGLIKSGDVQWMTAASGLVHEEFHGADFAKRGGAFEMVQLWVNLPSKDKMTQPRYQGIEAKSIPVKELADGAGKICIIAGDYFGLKGPALTFTPINLWDLRLTKGHKTLYSVPKGHTTAIFVLSGVVTINSEKKITDAEIAILEREGSEFSLEASTDAKVLFLGGLPINEPIIAYGPFVMNTHQEIQQAMVDFQNGKMGRLKPAQK